MLDTLNHAWYAVTRPGDCLCAMCLGACGDCCKPAIVPIRSRARKGYTPCCETCAVKRAKKMRAARRGK